MEMLDPHTDFGLEELYQFVFLRAQESLAALTIPAAFLYQVPPAVLSGLESLSIDAWKDLDPTQRQIPRQLTRLRELKLNRLAEDEWLIDLPSSLRRLTVSRIGNPSSITLPENLCALALGAPDSVINLALPAQLAELSLGERCEFWMPKEPDVGNTHLEAACRWLAATRKEHAVQAARKLAIGGALQGSLVLLLDELQHHCALLSLRLPIASWPAADAAKLATFLLKSSCITSVQLDFMFAHSDDLAAIEAALNAITTCKPLRTLKLGFHINLPPKDAPIAAEVVTAIKARMARFAREAHPCLEWCYLIPAHELEEHNKLSYLKV